MISRRLALRILRMHWLGKTLAVFVAIGALAAGYFSMKTLQVRTAWMTKVRQEQKKYEENIGKLQKSRAAMLAVRDDLVRTMLEWDRYWNEVDAIIADRAKGSVRVSIGTNMGLQDKAFVHAFATQPDGNTAYVGAFRVALVRENEAAIEPSERVRDVDLKRLETFSGQKWRIRTQLPAEHVQRFRELEIQLAVNDELLQSKTNDLRRNDALIKVANDHRTFRTREIEGDPAAQGQQLPDQYVSGLLVVLAKEEEARNAAVKEVDRLLRELKKTNDQFDQIREENRKLAEGLPRPAATTSEPVASTGR
jgi:hypothetical protein